MKKWIALLFVLPFMASAQEPLSLKISEILFNPEPNGADYVELYNHSDVPIALKDVRLAQWKDSAIHRLYIIDTQYIVAAGAYVVVTTDKGYLESHYTVRHPQQVVEVSSMPPYNDASGCVMITLPDSTLIERFDYTESMHSDLLHDEEGVALERRSFDIDVQAAGNWTSASSISGYGTPTYANSQSREFLFLENDFVVEPEIFSPDGDGYNDLLNITYQLKEENLSANITLFDAQGRCVRHLLRNGTLGTSGMVVWNGLDDNGTRCRPGYYVLVIEAYQPQGSKQISKRPITLMIK